MELALAILIAYGFPCGLVWLVTSAYPETFQKRERTKFAARLRRRTNAAKVQNLYGK